MLRCLLLVGVLLLCATGATAHGAVDLRLPDATGRPLDVRSDAANTHGMPAQEAEAAAQPKPPETQQANVPVTPAPPKPNETRPAAFAPPPAAPSQPATSSSAGTQDLSTVPQALLNLIGRLTSNLTGEEYDALKRGLPIFPSYDPADKSSNKFSKLRRTRNVIVQLIPQKITQIAETQNKIGRLQERPDNLNNEIANIRRFLQHPPADRISEVSDAEARMKEDAADLDAAQHDVKVVTDDLSQQKSDLAYLQNLLNQIDEAATELMIPESDQSAFKSNLSNAYAAIVAALIVGFFGISFWDPQVRRTIFSGQAGIQFVTLFSLVIAIILFGIVGILEAKELSALLGGISGYILGRTTGDRTGQSAAAAADATPPPIEATTISFAAPNLIADANNNFTNLMPNERIQVRGSHRNNGEFTIVAVTSSQLTVIGKPLVDEPVGARVTVKVL